VSTYGKIIRNLLGSMKPPGSNLCADTRRYKYLRASQGVNLKTERDLHPKTLIKMWITCLDPVSANSEKGRGSEWAVSVGQRLPSRFGQSGAARGLGLVQIVVEVSAIRGGLPST